MERVPVEKPDPAIASRREFFGENARPIVVEACVPAALGDGSAEDDERLSPGLEPLSL